MPPSDAGAYEAARAHYERGYALFGPAVLMTGDAGAAASIRRQFLDGGRGEITEERRREVEETIEDLERSLDGGTP